MNFRDHARAQAKACAALGSPFTARLLTIIADRLVPGTVVAERLLNWPADRLGPDAVALRLTGALHYLVLSDKASMLKRLYATPDAASDSQLWRMIDSALRLHAAEILTTLDSAPQTNELRRSAVLIAAAHWLSATYNLPLVLSELGCSAGLNLLWDSYTLEINTQRFGAVDSDVVLAPDWKGNLPEPVVPVIRARAGVDMNPLDPIADRLRLLSYIWPDQTDRIARTERALDMASEKQPEIARANAIDWLEGRLARPIPHAIHLVYHTVAWQYFSPEDQGRGLALLARAGSRCRADEPLALLSMEDDGTGPGAALNLHLWPMNKGFNLGRADFHGRWVDWHAPDERHWISEA